MAKKILIDEVANQTLKNLLSDQTSNAKNDNTFKSKTGLLIGTVSNFEN